MITFSANVTVTGLATFTGDSTNIGTINGNALFKGTSTNDYGGTINGSASFIGCASNGGTVTGVLTKNRSNACGPDPYYTHYDPPLLVYWESASSGFRRVVASVWSGNNYEQINMPVYGPWEYINGNSAWSNPCTYRTISTFDYAIDYGYNPEYEVENC